MFRETGWQSLADDSAAVSVVWPSGALPPGALLGAREDADGWHVGALGRGGGALLSVGVAHGRRRGALGRAIGHAACGLLAGADGLEPVERLLVVVEALVVSAKQVAVPVWLHRQQV